MSSTKGTIIWPREIRQDVRDLIELYFALVDSKDSTAGVQLADEVFTTDGKWFAAAGCFEGHGWSPLSSEQVDQSISANFQSSVERQHCNLTRKGMGCCGVAKPQTSKSILQRNRA